MFQFNLTNELPEVNFDRADAQRAERIRTRVKLLKEEIKSLEAKKEGKAPTVKAAITRDHITPRLNEIKEAEAELERLNVPAPMEIGLWVFEIKKTFQKMIDAYEQDAGEDIGYLNNYGVRDFVKYDHLTNIAKAEARREIAFLFFSMLETAQSCNDEQMPEIQLLWGVLMSVQEHILHETFDIISRMDGASGALLEIETATLNVYRKELKQFGKLSGLVGSYKSLYLNFVSFMFVNDIPVHELV